MKASLHMTHEKKVKYSPTPFCVFSQYLLGDFLDCFLKVRFLQPFLKFIFVYCVHFETNKNPCCVFSCSKKVPVSCFCSQIFAFRWCLLFTTLVCVQPRKNFMDHDAVGACFAAAKSSWSLGTEGEMPFCRDECGGPEL